MSRCGGPKDHTPGGYLDRTSWPLKKPALTQAAVTGSLVRDTTARSGLFQ